MFGARGVRAQRHPAQRIGSEPGQRGVPGCQTSAQRTIQQYKVNLLGPVDSLGSIVSLGTRNPKIRIQWAPDSWPPLFGWFSVILLSLKIAAGRQRLETSK